MITDSELRLGQTVIATVGTYQIAFDAYWGRYFLPVMCADGLVRPLGGRLFRTVALAVAFAKACEARNREEGI